MKVFISWSGDQSRGVAETLQKWLETVLAGRVTAWVSSKDIAKGERGLSVIAKELESGTFGLVVVTRANSQAPWINFEAGALGKSLGEARVATALVDLTPTDLSGPLSQFQATALTDRDDVLKLVKDIAATSEGDAPALPEETLGLLFESKWPELQSAVAAAVGGEQPTTERPEKEILEEVLDIVRSLARDRDIQASSSSQNEESVSLDTLRALLATSLYQGDRIREAVSAEVKAKFGGDMAMKDGVVLGQVVGMRLTDGGDTIIQVLEKKGKPPVPYLLSDVKIGDY